MQVMQLVRAHVEEVLRAGQGTARRSTLVTAPILLSQSRRHRKVHFFISFTQNPKFCNLENRKFQVLR